MDIVMWICVCTLACIGMACIIGDLVYAKKPGKLTKSNYRVITLYDNPAEVERQLNDCLLRLGWSGPDGVILLVDMGMGPKALEICERAMRDMYGAFFCPAHELADTMRRIDAMLGAPRDSAV
ncbi:MAG: hypothetical protein LBV27_05450 [Oscillospiraceae bacterium]|jgi:hypothetical protein|nr:hypothetical protein [Oscillospiraceae bacterium]